MTAEHPGIYLDPETEAAIERALDAADLRAGDATATVIQFDPADMAVEEGGAGDGD